MPAKRPSTTRATGASTDNEAAGCGTMTSNSTRLPRKANTRNSGSSRAQDIAELVLEQRACGDRDRHAVEVLTQLRGDGGPCGDADRRQIDVCCDDHRRRACARRWPSTNAKRLQGGIAEAARCASRGAANAVRRGIEQPRLEALLAQRVAQVAHRRGARQRRVARRDGRAACARTAARRRCSATLRTRLAVARAAQNGAATRSPSISACLEIRCAAPARHRRAPCTA